jgi:hypothetical protein
LGLDSITRPGWIIGGQDSITRRPALLADNTIDPATGARTAASDTLQFVYDNRDQLQLERAVRGMRCGKVPLRAHPRVDVAIRCAPAMRPPPHRRSRTQCSARPRFPLVLCTAQEAFPAHAARSGRANRWQFEHFSC